MPRNRKDRLPVRKTEPALVRGAVVAVLALLASLGVTWAANVSKDTLETIVVVAVVVIPLAQAAWTRYGVVARGLVLARLSASQGTVVAGEAATARTDTPLPARLGQGPDAVLEVQLDPSLTRRT